MTEFGEEWLEGIFDTFSLSDERGQTLFENLEDSACMLVDRFEACRTNKARSLYRGLARQYFKVAEGYAIAFEALSDDPVISWVVENGTFGSDKIESLRKKKENLRETIQTLEVLLKKPNHIVREKVIRGANLRRSRRRQLKKEAQGILEEVASFVESTKYKC